MHKLRYFLYFMLSNLNCPDYLYETQHLLNSYRTSLRFALQTPGTNKYNSLQGEVPTQSGTKPCHK